jgi:hypothetical protein
MAKSLTGRKPAAPAAAHTLTLTKSSKRKLAPDKVRAQLAAILSRAASGGREAKGWVFKAAYAGPLESFSEQVYEAEISFSNNGGRRSAEALARDAAQIVKVAAAAGHAAKWTLSAVDGDPSAASTPSPGGGELVVAQAEMPDDWRQNFSHIYDRDDQVELVAAAVLEAIDSDFRNRYHVCLYGDPAGGKTEIVRSFKKVLGDAAVLEYDATAMTQAGAIKDLDARVEIPPFLVIEEIEKAGSGSENPDSLRWLLSVLDHRGEIRKDNYRVNIHRECRMFCICTVNNFGLFNRTMSGALASRFPNKIFCPRADESILRRVLEREVLARKGKKAWIKPAVEYALARGIYDPRQVTSIALCGKDDLLTGLYQRRLDACTRPTEAENG